jgi:alpha-L-fucosidase
MMRETTRKRTLYGRIPPLLASLSLCAAVGAAPGREAELKKVERVAAAGPYRPTWESLQKHPTPDWYQDGKFGIFIHWGLYSVPAFGNEWYPRHMYRQGSAEFKHHAETYGPHSRFGYKDFIPMFQAERYDPDAWARLFKEAGAKFVVPVAEHHDGFAMYDTALSEWSAAKMGPKRDLIGDLAAAVRKQGLVFGLSSHRAEHWWFFDEGTKLDCDVKDPKYAGLYGPAQSDKTQPDPAFLDDWLLRTTELVDKYRPQLVWFDWWIEQPAFAPYLRKFGAYYYNRGEQWSRGVAINYKKEAFPEGAAVLDIERGQLAGIRPLFWQTDTSVSKNSWGFIRNHDYKLVGEIIHDLADIVSKNGALLLNIGPKPDGVIPAQEQQMLREIGRWLGFNGEAIYGTRPWKVFGEGPTQVVEGSFNDTKRKAFTGEDIRFTRKGNTLYAIVLGKPGEILTIKSLAAGTPLARGEVKDVYLLGHRRVEWTRDGGGLKVRMPHQSPVDYAWTLRITGLDL